MELGFDNDKYVKIQSENIRKRTQLFDKLYLEIGGKLFDDTHASRVLPGFQLDVKIKMFQELKKDIEVVLCISANDIERNKVRAEYGITYDIEVIRLIGNLQKMGFSINSVVVTLYKNQPTVDTFIAKLKRYKIKTYVHRYTKGYPTDIDTIVSEEGYGANPYIETKKKIILVTAPGPASGKLATCLSQLYHEHKRGVNAGYAKFETMPVWDLPLKHPLNIAYEAATADLGDANMIDYFHLEEYGVRAVSYNRDLEVFPVLKTILHRILGRDIYKSPTDMGVNMIGECITDDKVVQEASEKEIVRRYFNEMCNYKLGIADYDVPERVKKLMNELGIDEYYLDVVKPALEKSKKEKKHVVSLKLPSGKIITGKETDLLSPASSLILNAIKELSNIPDNINLLSPTILKPMLELVPRTVERNETLSLDEVLIALSISSVTNPSVERALDSIKELAGSDAHATYIVSNGDLKMLKRLKINLTCQPVFYSNKIYTLLK
ncbi:MAG: DUF1846 domain-containing protein [Candidatus Dojkabacteria bacterium]